MEYEFYLGFEKSHVFHKHEAVITNRNILKEIIIQIKIEIKIKMVQIKIKLRIIKTKEMKIVIP